MTKNHAYRQAGKKEINIKGTIVTFFSGKDNDFICLTDMAKSKNADDPRFVVQKWMSARYTMEFIGLWEQMHNNNFNRAEFDTFKNQAGSNSFSMSPDKWIKSTNAIGIRSKSGRYGGGTFAHKDIAFEFGSWLSAEFKLYLIKEFQRLKIEENEKLALGWDVKRMLTKINYRIHTDAIKENLIPGKISKAQENIIYANEADVLNIALFGMTAKEWRDKNPKLAGNIRDYADVTQLVCLANLENLNAEYIRAELSQKERLIKLNESAISQMKSLMGNPSIKKLK
ncbi:MAG: KilA-N domain-containing protein [Parcubacteria group bacterium]|jgi:hypothetical protein